MPSAMRGTGDNSLGAVPASAPDDVWALGNFVPDTANSNPDATLSLANRFDGKTWSAVPTPNAGPNFNTFFGVAAAGGKGTGPDQALIQHWDGADWSVRARVPWSRRSPMARGGT